MVVFEVSVNGAVLHRIGAEDLTKVLVMVEARGRLGERSVSDKKPAARIEAVAIADGAAEYEARKWAPAPLRAGDVVSIRLIESDAADPHCDAQRVVRGSERRDEI